MMKRLLLAAALAVLSSSAWAQNPTCPTRPSGDNSNACSSTAFVQNIFSGGGIPEPANTVFAGPTSGPNAPPRFRSLVPGDLPLGTAGYALIGNGASIPSYQGFLNPATGGVTRTWQDKAVERVTPTDFGADPVGVTSSSTAFTNAYATTNIINVPNGAFKLVASPTINAKSGVISSGNETYTNTGASTRYGKSATLTASATATNPQNFILFADTSSLQDGMLVSSQNISQPNPATACIPPDTAIVVASSTQVNLVSGTNPASPVALTCPININQKVYFHIAVPWLRTGPWFANLQSCSLQSDCAEASDAIYNPKHNLAALYLYSSTNFAGDQQDQPGAFNLISRQHGNTSLAYASSTQYNNPMAAWGGAPLMTMNWKQFGDGNAEMLTFVGRTDTDANGPAEGFQGLGVIQGAFTCGSATLDCIERGTEFNFDDKGQPANQTGYIARFTVSNQLIPGPASDPYIAACSPTAGAAAAGSYCRAILSDLTGPANVSGYKWGFNLAEPMSGTTSRFSTNLWARVLEGDFIGVTRNGIGGMSGVNVTDAGTGCAGAGTVVPLSVSTGAGAVNAMISYSGRVMFASVITPGSYTTAPAVTLGGCTTPPQFTVRLAQDDKMIGTTTAGVTQIWGTDRDNSLTALGTIDLMNMSTSNIMMRLKGSTGGGPQIYNGASAPTGGDCGAGCLNAATDIKINNVSVGIVNTGTAGQPAYYATSTNAVSPETNFAYSAGQLTATDNSGNTPGFYAQMTGDSTPRVRIGLDANNIASLAFGGGSASRDTFFQRVSAAKFRLGQSDAASPIAQTLSVQGVVATTANTAGADFTIDGSVSTGSAAGGAIQFAVSPAGGAGSSQNSLVNIVKINGDGKLLWNTDNTYDIGASGATRPRAIYAGTSVTAPSIIVPGASSGSATIAAQAAASTPSLTLPTGSGTFAVTASAPIALSATTGNLTCATCVTSSGGGAISGTAPIAVSAAGVVSITNGSGWTFRAVTDNVVGVDTTDTFTHKTYDTAGTGNSFSINGVAVTANSGTGSVARATSPVVTGLSTDTIAITGGTITASAGATNFVAAANTAAAYQTTDGTTAIVSIDTRNTVTGVTGWTLTHPVFSSSSTNVNRRYSTAAITPGTITWSGAAAINGTGTLANSAIFIDQLTNTLSEATGSRTIAELNGMFFNGPPIGVNTGGGGVNTVTNTYAVHIAPGGVVNGTNTNVTNATALFVEPPAGASNNYSIQATGGIVFSGLTTDSAQTDRTVCQDTTSNKLYWGSGTAGVCKGTSSKRYKHDIVPQKDGLAQIVALKPVNFRYNKGYGDDGAAIQYGFLAEDAVSVVPKLVGLDKDGKPVNMDYLGLVPILVKALQEQEAKITALEKRIH